MRRLAVSRVAMIVVPNVEPRSAWVPSGAPKETDDVQTMIHKICFETSRPASRCVVVVVVIDTVLTSRQSLTPHRGAPSRGHGRSFVAMSWLNNLNVAKLAEQAQAAASKLGDELDKGFDMLDEGLEKGMNAAKEAMRDDEDCLLYTSPSPRDA